MRKPCVQEVDERVRISVVLAATQGGSPHAYHLVCIEHFEQEKFAFMPLLSFDCKTRNGSRRDSEGRTRSSGRAKHRN